MHSVVYSSHLASVACPSCVVNNFLKQHLRTNRLANFGKTLQRFFLRKLKINKALPNFLKVFYSEQNSGCHSKLKIEKQNGGTTF